MDEEEKLMKDAFARNKQEFLAWLATEITEYWGAPCPDYCEGCMLCDAWRLFEQLKNAPL